MFEQLKVAMSPAHVPLRDVSTESFALRAVASPQLAASRQVPLHQVECPTRGAGGEYSIRGNRVPCVPRANQSRKGPVCFDVPHSFLRLSSSITVSPVIRGSLRASEQRRQVQLGASVAEHYS